MCNGDIVGRPGDEARVYIYACVIRYIKHVNCNTAAIPL